MSFEDLTLIGIGCMMMGTLTVCLVSIAWGMLEALIWSAKKSLKLLKRRGKEK